MEWFKKAVEKGYVNAMLFLGYMYRKGEGIEGSDPRTAMEWFTKAAEKGNEDAMHLLADMYYYGEGLEEPDYKAAMEWYEKAAGKRDTKALTNLAVMYERGHIHIMKKDFNRASQQYKKAAVEQLEQQYASNASCASPDEAGLAAQDEAQAAIERFIAAYGRDEDAEDAWCSYLMALSEPERDALRQDTAKYNALSRLFFGARAPEKLAEYADMSVSQLLSIAAEMDARTLEALPETERQKYMDLQKRL